MADARDAACREILARLAVADRLRSIADELTALEAFAAVRGIRRSILAEHRRVHVLADWLGFPLVPMRDVAAIARAQLGLPLDATSRPPRSRSPQWSRDLSTAVAIPLPSASSPAA